MFVPFSCVLQMVINNGHIDLRPREFPWKSSIKIKNWIYTRFELILFMRIINYFKAKKS